MSDGTAYRRGSIFGALLLITIGALFLYANLNPEFNPWPILAKYWPVLIIFWGLSRLMDYLMLRGTPEAATATRLGAGDIIGIIFILILGTVFTQVVRYGLHRPGPIRIGGEEIGCILGSEFEFSDQAQQAVTAPATFNVGNLRGNITITAGPRNEIRVTARKKICAANDAEGHRFAQAFTPVLEKRGDDYEFGWATQAGGSGLVRAHLDVQVPKATSLRLMTKSGDVKVSGPQGKVEIVVERGDAEVNDVDGDVRVSIRRGSVHVASITGAVAVTGKGDQVEIRQTGGPASLQGDYYGPIRFASIGGPASFVSSRTNFSAAKIDGEMTVESGEFTLNRVPGDCSLVTKDKEIEVQEISGEIRIQNRNGRVAIRTQKPPAYPIEVENRSGDIELALPASSGFEISATARDGRIESEFSGPNLKLAGEDTDTGEGSDTPTLTGTFGNGRAKIRLSTTHGTIYLRRSGS